MKTNSVDILCVQECRKLKSDKFWSDSGHMVLLSGSGSGTREWAGVGFIVSPRMQSQVIGFRPISNRIAVLKMRTAGGCVAFLSVLSPHNLKPLPESGFLR